MGFVSYRGYEAKEYEGRMKRYADVLITLNGGQACVQLFVQKHPIMFEREQLGNPMDCFRSACHTIMSRFVFPIP
jgi:recyclin-1